MSKSPALKFMEAAWAALPGGSWLRINTIMHRALNLAINGQMKFNVDDITTIHKTMRGHYWFGEGSGSHEHMYAIACGSRVEGADRFGGNMSACLSFEKWMGRAPYLWPEVTSTPERLYVGAELNWDGGRLVITSMDNDRLIACLYASAGVTIVGKIKKRVTITRAQLASARKAFDDSRKAWATFIARAKTLKELKEIEIQANHNNCIGGKPILSVRALRHFDIEDLKNAFTKRREELLEAETDEQRTQRVVEERAEEHAEAERRAATHDADLERWRKGALIHRNFNRVALRVRGERVEATNLQSVTVAGARKALRAVSLLRNKPAKWGKLIGLAVDEHRVVSLTKAGIKIGCTFIEWQEVDALKKQLKGVA